MISKCSLGKRSEGQTLFLFIFNPGFHSCITQEYSSNWQERSSKDIKSNYDREIHWNSHETPCNIEGKQGVHLGQKKSIILIQQVQVFLNNLYCSSFPTKSNHTVCVVISKSPITSLHMPAVILNLSDHFNKSRQDWYYANAEHHYWLPFRFT